MTSVSQIGCEVGLARAVVSSGQKVWPAGILVASCVGGALVFVSGSVMNVALADIGREVGFRAQTLQWMLNAEFLPLAALTLVGGALGDKYGQKIVFLVGLALLGLASLGGALANGGVELVAARLGQGIGEALILPTSLTILGEAYEPERKGWAIGIWSAAAAIASGIAPALAGFILDHASWRGTFLMQAPLAAIAIILAAIWVPGRGKRPSFRIDLAAAALSILSLGLLGWSLMALTDGRGSPLLPLAGLLGTALTFGVLVLVERRKGERAMLPPALFATWPVIALSLFTIGLYGAFTAILTLTPFVMIKGAHFSALVAGVAFIPLQIVVAILSPTASMLCRRLGHSMPLAAGAVITSLGCLAAMRINAEANYWLNVFPAVLCAAVGISLILAPMTTLVLTTVDAKHAATASGFNGALSRGGSLAAVAMFGAVLQRSGDSLFHTFHITMILSAAACLLAALAAFSIPVAAEPDPAFGL
jgi:MFS family permease